MPLTADRMEVKHFRLLDLPPEIWSNIGKLIVDDNPLLTHTAIWWARDKRRSTPWTKQPAITRTCRVLRQELLPFYYKNKALKYIPTGTTACQAVGRWLRAIGQHNRVLMGPINLGQLFGRTVDTLWKELLIDWKVTFKLSCERGETCPDCMSDGEFVSNPCSEVMAKFL